MEESGDNIEILFSDDGKGVAPTLEEHLLEPGVSGSDRAGMGLTIARNIATARVEALRKSKQAADQAGHQR